MFEIGKTAKSILALAMAAAICAALAACSGAPAETSQKPTSATEFESVSDRPAESPEIEELEEAVAEEQEAAELEEAEEPEETAESKTASELRQALDITEDYRPSFVHGDKGAEFQKYIVLHDTEGEGSAANVVDYWDSNGRLISAHFVINKDGSIVQCVPLDKISHHAGFGDTGHNELYGVSDESRDDKLGTTSIGSWASDYGMNSYSVGIELVHVGGSGDYPKAQLKALDGLIAYIDAYFGKECQIIDHKAWRTGNSDTSAEFAKYFENYKACRNHSGATDESEA